MFLIAKFAAFGILGSSSIILRAMSLIFSKRASYSSLFLGLLSFSLVISALKYGLVSTTFLILNR